MWDEAQPISEEEKTIEPRREEKNEIRRTRGNARNQKSPGSWEETAAVKECIQEAGGTVVCWLWWLFQTFHLTEGR